MFNKG